MRKMTVRLVFTLFVYVALYPFQGVGAQPLGLPSIQSSANDLVAAVNALRAANGMPAYVISPILMGTAQAQADFMAATGSVAHSGPGGIQLTQRLLNAGYPLAGDLSLGGFRAENITGGNKTAAQAVQEWSRDASHLDTMLSPNLTEIGAGVAKVGSTYYMVIDCALPTGSGLPQAYTPGSSDPVIGTAAPSDFIVPITRSTPDENGLVYHEVQYGQSLWVIAIEYGVKIDEIRALNGLGPETDIYQGDRLLVLQDAPPIPTALPVEIMETPTPAIQIISATSFPSVTPVLAETSADATIDSPVENSGSNSVSGIAIGIVLVAILFAGGLSWMSLKKSA